MQKIDFIKNLEAIVKKLKSHEIVEQFNSGFAKPGQNYNYATINPLLFSSKSNYDQIKDEIGFAEILASLNAQDIYKESNLSHLTTILRAALAGNILVQSSAVSLYNFHTTLLQTLNLSKSILQSKKIAESLRNEGDNGVVLFQILIEGEGLKTEQYIKIFTTINELIQTISKIVDEAEQKSEIILLDSGSDTNVGVRAGIETAKSLFLIFKEIWDFITNFKFYKQKQKNQALLESLTIRTEIQKKVDEGILTQKEGKEYLHMIKTRTDDLIGMKVLPKQIVIDTNQVENRKLLAEFEGMKMLTDGNEIKD
ncbi:hypothetical protein [Catalinimonas niigatensis]|uniref:hypothetical protein n=1 Tax=Catalinimonas niigatensis TaxID=1397264 RepID=UPI0026671BD8|nr:hypothetical protein [Catalinimonas niigatensis]WPP48819.1 hypothetical protein PZB72_19310 [Catalinimonas niigatensis]